MAPPLVRYWSSLTCRCNSRLDMASSSLNRMDARADARDVVQDFIECVEALVALENDRLRMMAPQRVCEQVQRLVRHRMGVRIRKERPTCILHGDAARHVH